MREFLDSLDGSRHIALDVLLKGGYQIHQTLVGWLLQVVGLLPQVAPQLHEIGNYLFALFPHRSAAVAAGLLHFRRQGCHLLRVVECFFHVRQQCHAVGHLSYDGLHQVQFGPHVGLGHEQCLQVQFAHKVGSKRILLYPVAWRLDA